MRSAQPRLGDHHGRPIACQYGPMPRPNAMANRPSVMACIVDPIVAVTVGCRVW